MQLRAFFYSDIHKDQRKLASTKIRRMVNWLNYIISLQLATHATIEDNAEELKLPPLKS